MVTRRLLPLTIMPMMGLPRDAGVAAAVTAPPPDRRHCGDPGGSFIACEALQDALPLATGGRCPLCGGPRRAFGR
ncbi:hypothetical protein GXW78_17765 [Roseomonas terrae]|uniref:Uncharacterized protein n=1 Tax=Neoroseomonas terrae TaxID=424799 RepID=A0ABS5ELP1_9PROT|nr:hypothetical protein [Neoroseomonas terrae]MBR0651522.1 hypothetical protein [Neoroseomonas terrae]